MKRVLFTALLLVAAMAQAQSPKAAPGASPATSKPSLKAELAALRIPPAWLADVQVDWDMQRPWKDGRLEIRRLLAGTATAKQAVKLTWQYYQKKDIGDGHELPMYLMMSGNYAWATVEYEKFAKARAGNGAAHAYLSLASLYMHFGEYAKAKAALDQALTDLPKEPWRINGEANVRAHRGDFFAETGDITAAKREYAAAMQLYPTSNQPYGRHLLKRQAAKVQTKLDLLTMQSLASAKLRDGVFSASALGYSDKADVQVTVTIQAGKISDVKVKHEEKIELDASIIVPQRIIEKQSLQVDGVTGATVTSQAIIDGAYQALRKAGLQ